MQKEKEVLTQIVERSGALLQMGGGSGRKKWLSTDSHEEVVRDTDIVVTASDSILHNTFVSHHPLQTSA